ncbi:MAG TPA: bifunctional UDP-sugar hydrolase/5'-nucleotidase [Ruminiclostridium sp.]
MKIFKRTVNLILIMTFFITCFLSQTFASASEKNLTILFTHDMHDHLLPTKIEKDNVIIESGGYSRLKTAIDQEKKDKVNNIVVDSGDYSMGDLFQSIYDSDAPELRIMGQMGYDVTTFGNHEFDFRDAGLTRDLLAAKNSGDKLPQIVNSNILFPTGEKMTKSLLDLKQAMSAYGVKEYTILNRGGIKIGVFGLIGKDAGESAPMTGVAFEDIIKSAKRTVAKLKNQENVDLIVCLSHSGTDKDTSKSEDGLLAKKVPEIDVIISGHTHTKLEKPIIVGKTIIGSCGEYSNNLGIIDLTQDSNGQWKMQDYKLKPIYNRLEDNAQINKTINKFKAIVQEKYLNSFDLKFDEVLARTQFSFVPTEKIGVKHEDDPLGNLITDGYIYSVRKAEGDNYEPISVAVVTVGTMRGSFIRGDITVEDAFISSSLGIGADGISGYPLISAYMTGKELWDLCEVDASISPIMSSAQLYMSGISFTFNPNRLIFNRVTDIHLQKPDGTLEEIDGSKLYRVVTGLYNAQMLSIVGDKSFGLLSIVPKTKDGKPITDFEAQIIYDSSNGRNNELKEWLSTAQYLKSFEKIDGIPQVPYYYSKLQNRKIVNSDKNVLAIMSHPNNVALKLYTVIAVVVAIIAFAVVMVATRKKRKQKHKSIKA